MKKIFAFSIIELIVSITIIGMITIGVFELFNKYLKSENIVKKNEKYENLVKILEKTMEEKLLNFILQDQIVHLEYEVIGGVKLNNKISSLEVLYEPFDLQPIIDVNSSAPNYDKKLSLWGLEKKELESQANMPYDIVFSSRISNYEDVYFPIKDLFVFDWGRLVEIPNFNKDVKECFFYINDLNEFNMNTFDILPGILTSSGLNCDAVIQDFANKNDKALSGRINKDEPESTFKSALIEIKVTKITTFDATIKKIKNTLNKVKKIENNLKDFSRRENELLGRNNELSIDHFVACYFDLSANNSCRINNFQDDSAFAELNQNKIKFIFNDGLWYIEKDPVSGVETNRLNQEMTIKDVKNMIMTFEPQNGAREQDRSIGFTKGTTGENIDFLREFENILDSVQVTGMIALNMPEFKIDNVDGFNKNDRATAGLGPLVFVHEAYKIFGLYDPSGSSKEGVSDFFDIPFYFTNVTGSSIRINEGTANEFRKNFDLNVPLTVHKNSINEKQISGPYGSGVLIIFPWIVSSNQELLQVFNYGIYFKTITTAKN